MKVLIISDTHGKHENLKTALDRERPIDLVVHLGDAEGYEDTIQKLAACPLEIVSGNSDFFSALDQEKENVVIESLEKLRENKLVLVVAHRQNMIQAAERRFEIRRA